MSLRNEGKNLPRPLAGRRKLILTRLILNGLAQATTTVVTALLVESAFNHMIMGQRSLTYAYVAAVACGLVAMAGAAGWLRSVELGDAEALGQQYASDIRMALFTTLTSLAPRSLQRRSQGAVVLRFVGDVTALRQWVSLGLARIAVASTTSVATLMALAFISATLSAAVGIVLVGGTTAAVMQGGRLRHAAREARRRRTNLASNVNEKVGSLAVVQAFGQTERERRRLTRQSRNLERSMVLRARVTGRLRGVVETTGALASAIVLLVGTTEVVAGRASPGTVVAAMSVVGLLVSPLRDLGRVQEYWHNSRVALEKVNSFLESPRMLHEQPGAPDLVVRRGHLELEEVRLSGSLEGISGVIEPNTVVALVGSNGAGKSSLLSVIARLVDCEGAVKLDGQDLATHSLKSVRRAIGIVGPDLPLLRGSVNKNLVYRWPQAPPEEVARVESLCELSEVLSELPQGAATRISEGGIGLSTGQRQRVALARALLGDPPVLLLDEADANLDAVAAAVVDRVIRRHRGIVLIATHRLARVLDADFLWHLEEGSLIASGSPEQLLKEGPTADLFQQSPHGEMTAQTA